MSHILSRRDHRILFIAALLCALTCLIHWRGVIVVAAMCLTLLSYRKVGQAVVLGIIAGIPVSIIWVMNYALSGTIMGPRVPSEQTITQVLNDARVVVDRWVIEGILAYAFCGIFMCVLFSLRGRQPVTGQLRPTALRGWAIAAHLRRMRDPAQRMVGLVVLALVLGGCAQYLTPEGGYQVDVSIRISPPRIVSTPSPTPTDDPTPTYEFATAQPIRYVTNTTNSNWNIRKEASATSEDLGDLKPGESVEYLFDVNVGAGWIGIAWEGGTAYVAAACCVDNG